MDTLSAKRTTPKAFTLIELLLVITIISVLAAVIVPRFFGRSQEARIVATRQTIVGTFGIALDLFEQDTGRYPTGEEGLMALIQDTQVRNWHGPYLKSVSIPLDPWGNPYKYSYPSELTSSEFLYDIVSAGPDGVYGNADDITNHDDPTRSERERER
ncbi:MAG TPA: type II secretion system major pseudopilin GspG [Sedimentisphaerales bacterium]|nr:type II secretion system major pseudopilin GspG [Sedimentisphaerales bacterium]